MGLTSGLVANEINPKNNPNLTSDNINIDKDKYLPLAYNNGQFFSWNHSNITSEHATGIYTSNDNKSYLLTNTGVFINLNYQILNFTRINDALGIAQISSYIDSTGLLWTNKNFIVALDSIGNFIVQYDKPIKTQNNDFVIVDDTHFFAYGVGLDLITISGNNIIVTSKVNPYENGYFPTNLYLLDATSALFINGDKQIYYLTDILGNFTRQALGVYIFANSNKVIGIIDNKHFVFRDYGSEVYYYDLAIMQFSDLNCISYAYNFFFQINSDEFIINTSHNNGTYNFGIPYLFNINNLSQPIIIAIKNNLINMVVNPYNQGVFIDGISVAYRFELVNDKFNFTKIGNIDHYQDINQNLGFGSFQGTDFLLAATSNLNWLLQKSIIISPISNNPMNFINNLIPANQAMIDHKNSYFSNGFLNLKINNKDLVSATVVSTQGTINLNPVNNIIDYNFSAFLKYKLTINFITNGNSYQFTYQINIDNFTENKLFNIFAPNIINYVGYTNNQLYDIQAIDSHASFTVTAFNYDLLQSVQLIRFDTNLVIRSIINVNQGDTIALSVIDRYALREYLCALKVEDFLNQTTMIYLGFIQDDGTKPMPPFWESTKGQDLRKEALLRNYTDKQLDAMNAAAINKLIQEATAWNLIKVQATTLAYIIIGAITISSSAAIISFIYNLYLKRKTRLNPKMKKEVIIDAQ